MTIFSTKWQANEQPGGGIESQPENHPKKSHKTKVILQDPGSEIYAFAFPKSSTWITNYNIH